MREVSSTIVVDAAVLVAAVLGRSSGALLEAARHRSLATTDRAVAEVQRRVELGLREPQLLVKLAALLEQIELVPVSALAEIIPDAETALRDAVASRNGATNDAHVLALSWALDADIWSSDPDFAGTGQPSWSIANLLRSLDAI